MGTTPRKRGHVQQHRQKTQTRPPLARSATNLQATSLLRRQQSRRHHNSTSTITITNNESLLTKNTQQWKSLRRTKDRSKAFPKRCLLCSSAATKAIPTTNTAISQPQPFPQQRGNRRRRRLSNTKEVERRTLLLLRRAFCAAKADSG